MIINESNMIKIGLTYDQIECLFYCAEKARELLNKRIKKDRIFKRILNKSKNNVCISKRLEPYFSEYMSNLIEGLGLGVVKDENGYDLIINGIEIEQKMGAAHKPGIFATGNKSSSKKNEIFCLKYIYDREKSQITQMRKCLLKIDKSFWLYGKSKNSGFSSLKIGTDNWEREVVAYTGRIESKRIWTNWN